MVLTTWTVLQYQSVGQSVSSVRVYAGVFVYMCLSLDSNFTLYYRTTQAIMAVEALSILNPQQPTPASTLRAGNCEYS